VITFITIEIAPRIEPDILPISKMGNRVVSLEPTKSIPSAKKPQFQLSHWSMSRVYKTTVHSQ
jgi:hypothetical protein